MTKERNPPEYHYSETDQATVLGALNAADELLSGTQEILEFLGLELNAESMFHATTGAVKYALGLVVRKRSS